MVDDEGANGGQLREGVRPGLRGEALGELFEHVVARVVAERHQKRGKKNRASGALVEAGAQEVGRTNKDVSAAAGLQRGLELGKRGGTLWSARAGKRADAIGRRQQNLGKGGSNDGMVLPVREQGRSEPQLVEARSGGAHRGLRFALQATARDVRRYHKHAACSPVTRVSKGVRQRHAHGPTARAGTHHHVGTDCHRKLAHKRGDTRVAFLAGQAAGYDQGVHHSTSEVIQKGSVPF